LTEKAVVTGDIKRNGPNPRYQRQHWEYNYGKVPEGWGFVTIGSLFQERTEKSNDQENIPLYSLTIEKGVTPKTERYERSFLLKDEEGNAFSVVRPGDFVFNPMNLRFGAIAYSKETYPVLVSAYYNVIIPNLERVDSGYMEALLRSKEIMDLYERIAIGSLVEKRRVHLSILNETYIPLPPIMEQNNIGNLLNKWDRTITLTEHLIAAKQERRKWLMQQLLMGRKRLQAFASRSNQHKSEPGSLPEDWGYPQIGKVAQAVSLKNGNGIGLPVLSCTKHQGLVDSLQYFGKQVFSQDLSTYKVVRRGHFAYATNHIDEGSIGYQNLHDKALISPMYTVFQADNSQIEDTFLFLVLKTETYRSIFAAGTSASVDRRGSLRWKEFSRIHIPLPPLEEQRKIVSVLETADRELDLLRAQLNTLREQKKGLMQQLLTGKKRVKISPAEATAEE
jgi:restriction endonuclease S subunit